jgi:cell division protein FtsW
LYTLVKGTVIAGANASRWIQVPFIGMSFQTSTLASVVFIFVSDTYLKLEKWQLLLSLLWELFAVFITLILILPANFSTTALILQ